MCIPERNQMITINMYYNVECNTQGIIQVGKFPSHTIAIATSESTLELNIRITYVVTANQIGV